MTALLFLRFLIRTWTDKGVLHFTSRHHNLPNSQVKGLHLTCMESISEIQDFVPDISVLDCSRLLRHLTAIRGNPAPATTRGIGSLCARGVIDWLNKFGHGSFAKEFAAHSVWVNVLT